MHDLNEVATCIIEDSCRDFSHFRRLHLRLFPLIVCALSGYLPRQTWWLGCHQQRSSFDTLEPLDGCSVRVTARGRPDHREKRALSIEIPRRNVLLFNKPQLFRVKLQCLVLILYKYACNNYFHPVGLPCHGSRLVPYRHLDAHETTPMRRFAVTPLSPGVF